MIPLYSSAQIREADNYAIKSLGIPGAVLMENAAINIVDIIYEKFGEIISDDIHIGILCGKGNNGGDGFAVARHFLNNRVNVSCLLIGKESDLKGDAKLNHQIFKNLVKETGFGKILYYQNSKQLSNLRNCDILLDAILGTGSKGLLRDPIDKIITWANKQDSLKIAVDIPTGLNVDTGFSASAFEADLTVTLAEYKKGLFLGKGKAYSGNVEKGEIGIGQEYFDKLDVNEYLIEPEDAYSSIPIRKVDSHKFSNGRVLTIAGSVTYPGAPVFAANSVLKSGAGSSKLAVPESLIPNISCNLNGSTLVLAGEKHIEKDKIEKELGWADVVLIGPGLGRETETQEMINTVLANKTLTKVIDADALFVMNDFKYKYFDLSNSVLTPHHKEFAGLINISVEELNEDLLKYGRNFAVENNTLLVLKGAPTIIFNSLGEAFINTTGNPGMAKFGSGDVLSGMIASFIAQNRELENSVISAVYLHSLSADLLLEEKTELSILAEDIIQNIPNALRFLSGSNL